MVARARASAVRLAAALSAPPAVGAAGGGARRTRAARASRSALGRRRAGCSDGRAVGLTVDGLQHGPLDGLDARRRGRERPRRSRSPTRPRRTRCSPASGARPSRPPGRSRSAACRSRRSTPRPRGPRSSSAPHDAALLADTVRRNVAAAAGGDATRSRARSPPPPSHDVVAALPDGLDTRLTDAGRSLSGGQRQRIALARALAAPAPVLVLHEPTTALDAATEARVAAALRAARAGRTTLLVTTSPALLAACDTVAVVRAGRATARTRDARRAASARRRLPRARARHDGTRPIAARGARRTRASCGARVRRCCCCGRGAAGGRRRCVVLVAASAVGLLGPLLLGEIVDRVDAGRGAGRDHRRPALGAARRRAAEAR